MQCNLIGLQLYFLLHPRKYSKRKIHQYFSLKRVIELFFLFSYSFVIIGLTAIEAWMLACILFVFGALVEYACILFRKQKVEKKEVIMVEYVIVDEKNFC